MKAQAEPADGAGAPLEVLVIEDHLAVRRGLELLLQSAAMRVAGVAATAAEARGLLARRRHDAVLVDVRLPDGDGTSLVREHLERNPDAAVVILTGESDLERLEAAARCGARGLVLKSAPPAELLGALRRVAAGGRYVDPTLAQLLKAPARPDPLSTLSPREREILELLAGGLNGEEVAQRLVISAETVRTHVRNAMNKLRARTRAHAVALVAGQRAGGRS